MLILSPMFTDNWLAVMEEELAAVRCVHGHAARREDEMAEILRRVWVKTTTQRFTPQGDEDKPR
jgi:hypothetical protein